MVRTSSQAVFMSIRRPSSRRLGATPPLPSYHSSPRACKRAGRSAGPGFSSAPRRLTGPGRHGTIPGVYRNPLRCFPKVEGIMVRKALVVEDEADTGALLAELLRRWGFEPTVLAEGKPAIPWVQQHQPTVILLDLMLPDIDGFEICETLKLERETNLIPIIMVTARTQ